MTKSSILTIIGIITFGNLFSQGTPIPQTSYTVKDASFSHRINVPLNAIDGDPNTLWETDGHASFPSYIEIDLGITYNVGGFSLLPRTNSNGHKPTGYEFYLSDDGINWGTYEGAGTWSWENSADVSIKKYSFGAISARYARLAFLSSTSAPLNNIQTAEIVIYESATTPTGQINQTMTFDPISDKFSSAGSFVLNATASTSMPITYSVVSGPATVSGNTVTLTGGGGTVELKAEQVGDGTYYPFSLTQSFEVFNLSETKPRLTTKLIEKYPLEMPSLMAYPIYMNSDIDHADSLSIDSITITVDGTERLAKFNTIGYYAYLWTPSSYGSHSLEFKSYASNGKIFSFSKNIMVNNSSSNQSVATLDEVDITFLGVNSRAYTGTYSLPQHVGAYDNLTANLNIACPPTSLACDDWDRRTYIDIKGPDGNWIQIIRYTTPAKVGCNHSIDLTDYADLLQGEIEFRIFIDTWGTGGWLVSLDFDFNAGKPTYNYSAIAEIWDGLYDFGNPANLQPLDTIKYDFPTNVEDAKLRVSTTGHGQGLNNSQSAAAYFEASNHILVNQVKTFNQNLWNECNPNPDNCTGQNGQWHSSRAGWCPGSISLPNEYSLLPYINSEIELIYEFDPSYEDLCHPNNPDCISATTCPTCSDGSNPRYDVDVHIVNYSNLPLLYNPTTTGLIENIANYDINLYPNPTKNTFKINTTDIKGETKLLIHSIDGQTLKSYFFRSNSEINNYLFDVSNLPNGIYFINIENKSGSGVKKLILQ